MREVECSHCGKKFFRPRGRINENKKLGHNFYCSQQCLVLSRYRRRVVECENCGKKFDRCINDISAHNYCSSSCAAEINNQRFPKRGPGFKVCKICFHKFQGENLYCSRLCVKQARQRYSPQNLLQSIKLATKELGRVPAKREVPKLASSCIYAFGSWSGAVKAAGLEPHRSHDHRMYKRTMTKAKDGHVCDSISEAIIDNWLTNHGVTHRRNVPYPDTNHKADWVIKENIFIEYFGLANDSHRYDQSAKTKQALCRRHGVQLIAIYPRDLYPKQQLDVKLNMLVPGR